MSWKGLGNTHGDGDTEGKQIEKVSKALQKYIKHRTVKHGTATHQHIPPYVYIIHTSNAEQLYIQGE